MFLRIPVIACFFTMAYVPPHKRLSKTEGAPPSTPERLVPHFKKNLNIHARSKGDKQNSSRKKIIYADHSISRRLVVPVTDDDQVPTSVKFVPISMESVERKTGMKPLTLVDEHSKQEHSGARSCFLKSPWITVAKNIHSDLLSASNNVKLEMENEDLDKFKAYVVARFGKVLYQRSSSVSLDSLNERSICETRLTDLKKTFYTNVSASYMERTKSDVVSRIRVKFEEEKELYHVKLADAKQPKSTISCKCRVLKGEKKLEVYKMDLNPVRHLVVDVSCADRNVDLRLALCTKKIIMTVTDEELQDIRELINSAILDQNLKGGLKWPLEKANSGSQFSVVGVWHTKTESYSNHSMRLKMREADRYDFLSSTGEVTRETVLKLTGITNNLLGGEVVDVSTMLEDTLKLIWDSFLSWDGSLV